jgi:hypothetical protein
MVTKLSKRLSQQEFTSLLTVGKTAVNGPPAVIPAEHDARLIRLGHMMDLAGRLRLTGRGRARIAADSKTSRRNDHRPNDENQDDSERFVPAGTCSEIPNWFGGL